MLILQLIVNNMFKYILKMLKSGFKILWPLLAGAAGAMIYPVMRLLRLSIAVAIMVGGCEAHAVNLAMDIFKNVDKNTPLRYINAVTLSVLGGIGMVLSFCLIALPLLAFRAILRILILAPKEGFNIGKEINLSYIEGQLLSLLSQNPGRIYFDAIDYALKDFTGLVDLSFERIIEELHSFMLSIATGKNSPGTAPTTDVLDEASTDPTTEVPAEVSTDLIQLQLQALHLELQNQNLRLERQLRLLRMERSMATNEESQREEFLEALSVQISSPVRNPMTDVQFQQVQLRGAELTSLIRSFSVPLSQDELRRLEQNPDASNELQRYRNLLRLKTDECCILQDRPEDNETVLLVKQYQVSNEWLSVPGVVSVQDRESLRGYLLTDARHPTNRDSIINPPRYVTGNVSYPTRYVIHPYYIGPDFAGVAQEVNLLTLHLRDCLDEQYHADAEFAYESGPLP